MACDCIFEIQNRESERGARVFEGLSKNYGEVEQVECDNAAFFFGENKQVPVALSLKLTLANGKKKKTNLIASFCPICGLDKNGKPAEKDS